MGTSGRRSASRDEGRGGSCSGGGRYLGPGGWRSAAPVAGRLTGGAADDDEVVAGIAALTSAEAPQATLQVLYPQTTGISTDRAGVIALVRQVLLAPDGTSVERELVLDVRLRPGPGATWVVSQIVPTSPLPPGGVLTPTAAKVLQHPGVVLPGPARADIETGRIDDGILTVLAGLGEQFVIGVHEIYDGHPVHVFGTDKPSRHSQGRAVDVVSVDGTARWCRRRRCRASCCPS